MWKIYYRDGEIYCDANPANAQKRGVICILQPNDDMPGYHIIHGAKYYLWRDEYGMWQGADDVGKMLYELEPGWKVCLFGEWLPSGEFDRIMTEAMEERDRLNRELE